MRTPTPRQKKEKKFTIPCTPFHRIVREITQDLGKDVNFKKEAMEALQDISEQMLVELFVKSDIVRNNIGRQTLHIEDVKFAKYVTDNKELLDNASKVLRVDAAATE
jgi:histone H3/H4